MCLSDFFVLEFSTYFAQFGSGDRIKPSICYVHFYHFLIVEKIFVTAAIMVGLMIKIKSPESSITSQNSSQ